jgi:hypothetical protein
VTGQRIFRGPLLEIGLWGIEIVSFGPPTINWSGTLKGNLFSGAYKIDMNAQSLAAWPQQRYRAPILRSWAAMTKYVITTATNGAALACSIEHPHGGSIFHSPVYRALISGVQP